MATPLRYDMILPNGEPLRWNTPGARWNGTVEEVMAAINAQQPTTMATPYNKISVTIGDQTVADIAAKIAELDTLLNFCVPVSDDDRRSMQKLGPATDAYAAKTFGYMGTHPEYNSPLFPLAEVTKDSTGYSQMDKFMPQLSLLFHKAEGTQMLLGSEYLRACNAYMNNTGEAAHRGQAEAEPIYKDLAEAYPGPGAKAKTAAKKANPSATP